MFTRTSRWVPTDSGSVWIGFEPQLQADAAIQPARKDARKEGRNLVLESEEKILQLGKEGVEGLWADEDDDDEEEDEESDQL